MLIFEIKEKKYCGRTFFSIYERNYIWYSFIIRMCVSCKIFNEKNKKTIGDNDCNNFMGSHSRHIFYINTKIKERGGDLIWIIK